MKKILGTLLALVVMTTVSLATDLFIHVTGDGYILADFIVHTDAPNRQYRVSISGPQITLQSAPIGTTNWSAVASQYNRMASFVHQTKLTIYTIRP